MEKINCNLCGSDKNRIVYSMPDSRYFQDEWFTVVECINCGLGFVNPRPTVCEMPKYYPPSYYDYFDQQRDYHRDRYASEGEFVSKGAVKGQGLLLDIGCANGDFPRFMRDRGWRVEAVEVSPNSRAITDFKVYKQTFGEIEVDEPRYDAVTAWAVLEHVHDPMAYFRKAARVLKSGGVFVFLVTNFKSLSSRRLFLEDVPRHLYFFTEETIKDYLATSSFDLIHTDFSNKIYSMRPLNLVRYYFYRYIKRRTMEWRDTRIGRSRPFREICEGIPIIGKLKHLIFDPIDVFDQLMVPICERYQIVTKTYGIVTYVARRR